MPKKAPAAAAAAPSEEEAPFARRPVDKDTPATDDRVAGGDFPGKVSSEELDDEELASDPFEDEAIVGLEETEDYLTGLWYGIQGTGKTTDILRALAACPEGNAIICNAEGGMKLKALAAQGVDTSRVRVWPKQGVRPTFDGLERLVLKVDADLAKARANNQPKPWAIFGLDSVTELVKLMLDNIAEDGVAGRREIERKAKEAGVKAPTARNGRARFKAERDDYQLVSGQMRAILRKLRYMDLHFLMTALVRRDEDEDTGITMYGPATPPALQQDLLGYADVVIRTEVDADGKYMGYTRPDETHHGKDRYGLLPVVLENPTADRVLAIIAGETVVDSDLTEEAPDNASETTEDTTAPENTPEADEAPEEPKKPVRRSRARATTSAARASAPTITARVAEPITAASGDAENPPF